MTSNSLRNNTLVAQDQGSSLDCIAYALARILNVLSRNTSLVYDDSVFDTALSILKAELHKFKAAKIDKPAQLRILEYALHWSSLPVKMKQYIKSLESKWESNKPDNVAFTFVSDLFKRRSLHYVLPNDIGQYLEVTEYTLKDKTKVVGVLRDRRRILFEYFGYPALIEFLHNEAIGLTPITDRQIKDEFLMLKSEDKVRSSRRGHCVVLRSWEGGRLRFTDSYSPRRGHYGDFCIDEAVLELDKEVFNYRMYDIYLNENLPSHLRENMKCEIKRPTLPVVERGYFFQIRTSMFILGSGSFGNVCRGRIFTTGHFNRSVAVKSLHWLPSKKMNQMKLKLFKYEHPNIVEIYGFTILPYFYYSIFIAMEEHIPLTHIFSVAWERARSSCPLGWGWNYFIAHDIASGIQFLHLHNVCHGDVSMANVVVSVQGIAKLIDLESVSLEGTQQSHHLLGHVGYQGGRSRNNHKLNRDTHNLGALIAHLVTGENSTDIDPATNFELSKYVAGLQIVTMEVIKVSTDALTEAFISCGIEKKAITYRGQAGCTFVGKNEKGVVEYLGHRKAVILTNGQYQQGSTFPLAHAYISFTWMAIYFLQVVIVLIFVLSIQWPTPAPQSLSNHLQPVAQQTTRTAAVATQLLNQISGGPQSREFQEISQFVRQYERLSDTVNIEQALPDRIKFLLSDLQYRASKSVDQILEVLERGNHLRAAELSVEFVAEVYPSFIPYWCLPDSMTQSEYVFGNPIDKSSVGLTVDGNWVSKGVDFFHHYRVLLYQVQQDYFICLADYFNANNLSLSGSRYLNTSNYNKWPVCFNPITKLHFVDELRQISLDCQPNPRLKVLVKNVNERVFGNQIYNKRTVMKLAAIPWLSKLVSTNHAATAQVKSLATVSDNLFERDVEVIVGGTPLNPSDMPSHRYVKSISVVYRDSYESQPENALREVNGGSNDINYEFGGSFVFLVPEYTDSPDEALTSLHIEVQSNKDTDLPDLAKGAGGYYRYLVGRSDSNEPKKIVDVALVRSGLEVGDFGRYEHHTIDINWKRSRTYLYVVWNVHK